VPAALILSAFVLIGNPLIVMAIMGYMGYRKRTGLFARTVAQISEFSLIFMAMGVTLGHVPDEAIALVTLVGLITITLSTYMILYSGRLYQLLEPFIGLLERRVPYRETGDPAVEQNYDVILVGLGRYGREIARALHAFGMRVLGVDFDPEALARWRKRGLHALYGDAADPEFAATLPLAGVAWVVIAAPGLGVGVTHEDGRVVLLRGLREAGFEEGIAVRCDNPTEARALHRSGATLILSPFSDGAVRAAELIGKTRAERSREAEPRRASTGAGMT
jgi:voltage-gated potassium channel Kch